MTTDLPAPAFAGQSPGRGDGGADRGGGGDGAPEEALDEPHPGSVATRPIAAIVRSRAAPPATRPMPFRNSRRAILAGPFTGARLRLAPAASLVAAFCSSSHSPERPRRSTVGGFLGVPFGPETADKFRRYGYLPRHSGPVRVKGTGTAAGRCHPAAGAAGDDYPCPPGLSHAPSRGVARTMPSSRRRARYRSIPGSARS